MEKITIKSLVTKGLGYCCEAAFFRAIKQTGAIATRLGVSDRAVRYRKELFNEGKIACEHCPNCMDARLTRLKK